MLDGDEHDAAVAEAPAGQPVRARSVSRPAPPVVVPTPPRAGGRRWVRGLLFLLLPIALIAGFYWYVTGGAIMSTDDAYVEADKVGISTDVSGIVTQVDVADNQAVTQGQVLYRLDDQPFRIALRRAEAQVGMVADTLRALQSSYRDAQAQIRQAQNDVQYYGVEFHRQDSLLATHASSQSAADLARRNLDNSEAKLVALTAQLGGIAANLNGDPAGPIEQNPQYQAAVAARDEAARELSHTIVRAPFAGIVTNVPQVAPGKYLAASTTAFDLVSTEHVWVMANPKETQLTYVHPGQTVTVTADTFPDVQWHGTVGSISPAAAQEFSLLPAQNTSGNWVKVVQRIPLRVRVDTSSAALPQLRAGMSVEVDVDTGHTRGLPHFLAGLFGRG